VTLDFENIPMGSIQLSPIMPSIFLLTEVGNLTSMPEWQVKMCRRRGEINFQSSKLAKPTPLIGRKLVPAGSSRDYHGGALSSVLLWL